MQADVTARYAIYFAPVPDSDLGRFGTRWFGDASAVEAALDEAIDRAYLASVTSSPRHYGFHATLKAPFALADGRSESELRGAVQAFAARCAPITAPPLELTALHDFMALTLSAPSRAVDELAADCVRAFEPFRAPLSPAMLERRRQAGLSARQEHYLARWGYPYVMAEFRFHMTLSNRLDPTGQERLRRILAPLLAPLEGQPLEIDGLALFHQAEAAADFNVLERFRFSA